jgi:hypothetical protein
MNIDFGTDCVTATRDLFAMIPAVTAMDLSVYMTHIRIGELVIKQWLATAAKCDDMTLCVDAAGVQDAYMRLLYAVTSWLFAVSSWDAVTASQRRQLCASLTQLRANGLHIAAALAREGSRLRLVFSPSPTGGDDGTFGGTIGFAGFAGSAVSVSELGFPGDIGGSDVDADLDVHADADDDYDFVSAMLGAMSVATLGRVNT